MTKDLTELSRMAGSMKLRGHISQWEASHGAVWPLSIEVTAEALDALDLAPEQLTEMMLRDVTDEVTSFAARLNFTSTAELRRIAETTTGVIFVSGRIFDVSAHPAYLQAESRLNTAH
jgi:predicted secreted protein